MTRLHALAWCLLAALGPLGCSSSSSSDANTSDAASLDSSSGDDAAASDDGGSGASDAPAGDAPGTGCTPGAGCTPATSCHIGAVACSGSSATCTDEGPNPEAVSCGNGQFCNAGTCGACVQFLPCSPKNPCDVGQLDCTPGMETCDDIGPGPGFDGLPCGGACNVCSKGACVASSAGKACLPANHCHKGVLACSGGGSECIDEGPDPGRDGYECGPDMACVDGTCQQAAVANSGGIPQPIVPDRGGPVIASPKIVLITYDTDPYRTTLEPFATWLATGGYLQTVGSEYGVGNGTAVFAHLNDSPPANFGAAVTYLTSHIASGALPAITPDSIYVLFMPSNWSSLQSYCATYGPSSYHDVANEGTTTQFNFAFVVNCTGGLPQAEVSIAHEVVEDATDPLDTSYFIEHGPWNGQGGEVADLCESNTRVVQDASKTYSAPLIWSNRAVIHGQVPCQPWPAGANYLSIAPSPSTIVPVPRGSKTTFTLTGWSSMPFSGNWDLVALDADEVDFSTSPTLSATSIGDGTKVTLTLSVPASAPQGYYGGAWVIAQDQTTGQNVGSTVVEVVAQ